jgi:tripartite-type tricarboxylate transporter receptor subunit TctC
LKNEDPAKRWPGSVYIYQTSTSLEQVTRTRDQYEKGGETDMKSGKIVFIIAAFVLLITQTGVAQEDASKYPSKPITFISPYAPGAALELSSRLLTRELEKILGQPVVVVNKPGAANVIGTAAVAAAKPDGYTIGYTGGAPLWFTPQLEKVPYDPLKDLKMVAGYGEFNAAVAVKGDSPFKTFKDLINYARQNPKKVAYGTAGTNSITHIAFEQIAKQENVQMTHIPFQGDLDVPLLGGHITFGGGNVTASLVESGKLRLLMMLKDVKSAEYPNVPRLKDLGYNIPWPLFPGVIVPTAVPDAIVKKLDDAIGKAVKAPSFIKGMDDLNLPVVYRSSKELDTYIAKNYEYFNKVFKEMGLIK